jgi:hypothetical protein
MNPFSTFLAATLLLPVADGDAPARKGCAAKKPFNTQIEINLDIPETRYKFDVPGKKLTEDQQELTTKWKSEHEDHVWASQDLSVEGLARGGMGIMSSSRFVGMPYDSYGLYYCPYVKKLTINVHYNTLIFVAREHKKETCRFNAIMDHENRHHETNVQAVKDVMVRLNKDLPEIIAYMEKHYVPRAQVENSFSVLSDGLNDALKVYSAYMLAEMSKRNAPIDSPEEYQRVDSLCPHPRQ